MKLLAVMDILARMSRHPMTIQERGACVRAARSILNDKETMSRFDIDGEWSICPICEGCGTVDGPGGDGPCYHCSGKGEVLQDDAGEEDDL